MIEMEREMGGNHNRLDRPRLSVWAFLKREREEERARSQENLNDSLIISTEW
jgi:hypothetical protein